MKYITMRDKPAIIYKDKEISYKELIRSVLYYADMLELKNPEDKVVVFMENRPEISFAIFSTWEKNGIAVTVDASSTAKEVAYFLKDSKPYYLYTSNKNLEVAKEAVKISGEAVKIVNLDEVKVPDSYEARKDHIVAPVGDQTVLILYTSGTTGEPKGVMLTMKNLLSNINNIIEIGLYREEDRLLALLPLHHVLPLVGCIIAPVHVGSTCVILDDLSSEAIKEALQKYKITTFIGVPRLWEMFHKGIMSKINSSFVAKTLFKLVAKTNNVELGKKVFKKVQEGFGGEMHILVSGGAKIDPQIIKDFKTLGFHILEGYGLTESSPIITFTRYDDIRPGSCGGALPGIDLKIADDGEILARGDNITKGYYNKPEATREAIDEDGWFHTGDLGEIRDDYLYIIGRKKEMIVLSNGKNINPNDIEIEIMRNTNLIKELAVTEYNSHLVAIVYPDLAAMEREGVKNISQKIKWDIIDPYNIEAPTYKKILDIKIINEELPKTKLGKLRRFKLPELLGDREKTVEKIVEPTTKEYEVLKKYITKLKGVTPNPKDHFELDLGMDSLDFVELLSFIGNNFNIIIPDNDFSKFPTIYDLANYLCEQGAEITEQETDWVKLLNEDLDLSLPKSSWVLRFGRLLLKPLFNYRVKVKAIGKGNLRKEPAIFIGNHQSMLDAFILNHSLDSKILRNTYYLAVSKHFNGAIKKWAADNGNVILLDIEDNLGEALKAAAMVLKQGKNLVVFPEGARSRDGEMLEFKKSFAILSKTLDVPVQPFVINGAYESMPIGVKFPRATDVSIEFLPVVSPKKFELEEIIELCETSIKNKLL